MNDVDLDEKIRTGLRQSTDEVGRIDPAELARRLTERRGRAVRPGRGRIGAIAAIALTLAGIAGGLLLVRGEDGTDVVSDGQRTTATGFGAWGPGWHEIDPGPVPAMSGASLTWTGDHLVVAGTSSAEGAEASAQVFAFDPGERTWERLPDPPFGQVVVVSAADKLVAVGSSVPAGDQPSWATLSDGASEWEPRGPIPAAPELAAAGGVGPAPSGSGAYLVWTGELVIDVTHGAVLDPGSGWANALVMPSDVVEYTHLLGATPVWTGEALVLQTWSTRPGLAWDAFGERLADVPGLGEGAAEAELIYSSAATASAGRVVLVAGSQVDTVGRAAMLSRRPDEGIWTDLPAVPGPANDKCPYRIAAVGADVVVFPCGDDPGTALAPVLLHDGRWSPMEPPPGADGCCLTALLGTDEALITWSTDTDTMNNPDAPYRRGAVWIP